MFLDGFSLEVLVNSSTLQEYREPVYNYKVYLIINLLQIPHMCIYRRNSAQPSQRFTNPILVETFVDGNHDFLYYCLVAPAQTESDGFWNVTRDKKAYFKFSKALWTNDEIDTNNLPRKVAITESKENKGIEFSTEFKERSESPPPYIKKCIMKPADNSPIAVLNIHYCPMNFRTLPLTKKDDTVSDVKLEEDVVFVKNSNSESSSSSLVIQH
ncbi:6997_t:CDS:2 [Ambispora leptoticha]|uniref:6997_t:CDS:1 n=1 Tax=Ambispora leptoticha TaxID=144679 RepID=A0A9N9G0V1_9GLOM|nr:6997_t:CDS:2 [Ambispora leptoticha]